MAIFSCVFESQHTYGTGRCPAPFDSPDLCRTYRAEANTNPAPSGPRLSYIVKILCVRLCLRLLYTQLTIYQSD